MKKILVFISLLGVFNLKAIGCERALFKVSCSPIDLYAHYKIAGRIRAFKAVKRIKLLVDAELELRVISPASINSNGSLRARL